jgi:AN1-like Zinc finger
MELDGVGSRCTLSTCRAVDYLPIRCASCSQPFCADHAAASAHSCTVARTAQVVVPTCPVCNRPVPAPPGVDAGTALAIHIETGCPRRARTNPVCGKNGCKVRDVAPVVCRACKGTYCMNHRLEADHECMQAGSGAAGSPGGNALAAAMKRLGSTAPAASTAAAVPEPKLKKKLLVSLRSSTRSRSSRSRLRSPHVRDDGLVPLTAFQNAPTALRVDSKVPEDERLHLAVFFPISMQRQPEWRYFNSRWSAGKVMDDLKLPELSEPGLRYSMHAVKPGFKGANLLPRIKPLRDVGAEILCDGDLVVIEAGEGPLSDQWEAALAGTKVTSPLTRTLGFKASYCAVS